MNYENPDNFAQKMFKLRQVYIGYLNDWRVELQKFYDNSAFWLLEDSINLHATAHKLTGSGTTYGFPQITDAARALEYKLAYDNIAFAEGGSNPNNNALILSDLKKLIAVCSKIHADELNQHSMIEQSSPISSVSKANGKTVLIVDDQKSIRDILIPALKSAGLKPLVAADGDDALLIMEEIRPDAVILDRIMPNLDGMSVLKMMRKVNRLKDIPVIFLTAYYAPEYALEAEKLGVVHYLSKPFNPDEIAMHCLNLLSSAS